jgi:hypothetical protein
MAKLELYAFRFRDPLTGKWTDARHRMQVPEKLDFPELELAIKS